MRPSCAIFAAIAFTASAWCSELKTPAPRERLSLDQGWIFHRGDIVAPVPTSHDATYQSTKAGRALGAAAPDYDDSAWRRLDLPHDWAIEGPFDPAANVSHGYRPRGVAWYRRHFRLDDTDRDRHLELQFDGVAIHCTVWVNGTLLHRNWCGTTSFTIDLTPLARFGDALNTIAVRVDAEPMEGWWYEGAGIYRHTWLTKRDPVHLATDGIFAQPVRDAGGRWTIPLEATLANSGGTPADCEVVATLLDPEGASVAQASTRARVEPLGETLARMSLAVSEPRLWSVDTPVLYRVRTAVVRDGAERDSVETHCGFRTIRFDPERGFLLNDQPLKIQGVCNHQDHAGVGVAVPDALWDFRIRRLKEMGANAYRCAHHPPAAEFLDACDRLGLLVMDENRHFNVAPEYLRQLAWLVRRDRNHPSVILWSVFNEEPMQGTANGYEMVRRMVAVVRSLDTTRPVTAAMSDGFFTDLNVSDAVDVVGFNYNQGDYDRFHAGHRNLPLISSEDTSAFMTRGEFLDDPGRCVLASYDTHAAAWGATHRAAWRAIAERPYLAGGFVWTGFDYRGEPQPNVWPAVGSVFGAMDQCGFPKTAFFIHQAHWIKDRPILHLVPHWNWAGRDGEPIKVMAISNADHVSLALNGAPLDEKPVDPFDMVSWNVPYAAGRLEAVAWRDGINVARCLIETTGPVVELRLVPDRSELLGDGRDALPITVEAIDAEGRVVPTAAVAVSFSIDGPARILGHGNGDPTSHELENGPRCTTFNGLAQLIIGSRAESGPVLIRASAEGFPSATAVVHVRSATPPVAVPAAFPTPR